MVTMNVSLPDRMKKKLLERVENGDYANVSDYVRDLIRKDIGQREILTSELRKGEASGLSARKVPAILSAAKRGRQRKGG